MTTSQPREALEALRQVLKDYNLLDQIHGLKADVDRAVRAGIDALDVTEAALAECYRLSGADPDGNEAWRLAPHAVEEVRRLRAESDRADAELLEVEEIIRAALPRYRMTAMGCSNCGGQPCTSTCLVGQLEAWLQRVSHGTPSATSAKKAVNA